MDCCKDLADFSFRSIARDDLRHPTIYLLYEAGVPEGVITEIAGQFTRSTTWGYTSHSGQKCLAEAMLQLLALSSGWDLSLRRMIGQTDHAHKSGSESAVHGRTKCNFPVTSAAVTTYLLNQQ